MLDRPALSPYSFMSFEHAANYVRRPTAEEQEEGDDDMLVLGLNAVVGLFRRATGRRLACRTYRNPVSVNITTASGQATVTGTGFSALKTLDDATHVGLPTWTRIGAIASDASMTLTFQQPAQGPITAGLLTGASFGSQPLKADSHWKQIIHIPEFPVQEVYAVYWIDALGTKWPVDLTGSSLERSTGRLLLRKDIVPRGELNLEIECKAGYLRPAPGVLGDEEWGDLELHFGRALQVMFQDWKQSVGRTGSAQFMQMSQEVQDFSLPDDIVEALERYRRRM